MGRGGTRSRGVASVVDVQDPLSDLDLSIAAPSGDARGSETYSALLDGISQDAASFDEGSVPTPNSSLTSASRAAGCDTNQPEEVVAKKSRRVRTGCLTCRERHLKCDEAQHRCQNCRKSGRICRRGIRLNFIDTQVVAPPHYIVPPFARRVTFRDESRHIASEYVGGSEKYPPPEAEVVSDLDDHLFPGHGAYNHLTMPAFIQAYGARLAQNADTGFGTAPRPAVHPGMGEKERSVPFHSAEQARIKSSEYACLNSPEEMFLLQAFVEEVGLWMDSMDEVKHFTHILPYHALEEPMLLKAFMACGARHIYLINPSYGEDKASYFHDEASSGLLHSLRNPGRDSALCATTAVILNVYELMCSNAMLSAQGLNHIAGARALIKECQWDAKTQGLGGACFWLNVGMELLSCLHFNWTLSWDPDTWGVDMNLDQTSPSIAGNEEIWAHRMIYICAKASNFRSSMTQFLATSQPTSSVQMNQRYREWCTYSEWCDRWENASPRSMKPLGYLHQWQTHSRTVFPNIWLIKQSSMLARLFYHTTQIILTKTHPFESEFSPVMQTKQQQHAHDICGIVAHVKDRGIASLSIRFLAIAAGCLATREAQEEIIHILDNIIKETGWRAEHIKDELQEIWGWTAAHKAHPLSTTDNIFEALGDTSTFGPNTTTDPVRMPLGVVNPIMAFADFSMENHPYRDYYVAPHHAAHYQEGGF